MSPSLFILSTTRVWYLSRKSSYSFISFSNAIGLLFQIAKIRFL